MAGTTWRFRCLSVCRAGGNRRLTRDCRPPLRRDPLSNFSRFRQRRTTKFPTKDLSDTFDADIGEVADTEFKFGGIGKYIETVGVGGEFGGLALPVQFLKREHIERDGVSAEAQFVQGNRIVQ